MIRANICRHISTKGNFFHFGHFAIRQDVAVKIGSSRKKRGNSLFTELSREGVGARGECVPSVEVLFSL